jgi:phage gpG-like protein
MNNMRVTVTITGDAEEIARFQKLGRSLTDYSGAMRSIGKDLKTYYGSQPFASEGGVLGQTWRELSPVYRKWKGRHYPGKGILVASGGLKSSFRSKTTKNSATIDNTKMVGSHNLLDIHQNGRGRNPKRPVLLVNDDVTAIVHDAIEDDIKRKLKEVS